MKSITQVLVLGVFFTSIYAWAIQDQGSQNEDDLWLISHEEPVKEVKKQPSAPVADLSSSPSGITVGATKERKVSRVSSQALTLGVETEEHEALQFFGSLRSGAQNFVGNQTLSSRVSTPSLTLEGGAQLSSSFQVYLSFQRHSNQLGAPLVYTTNGNQMLLNAEGSVFDLNQTQLFLGGRMYFRNRDAVVRPYFGGNFGFSRGNIDFRSEWQMVKAQSQAQSLDFHQLLAGGELGVEFAITRSIALILSGKVQGVLSTLSNLTVDVANAGVASQTTAGNALSKTAVVGLTGGLSFYF